MFNSGYKDEMIMWDNKIFFEKLEVLLKEKGWSLCELSAQAGLSSGMIYRWRNDNRTPSMESLQKISNALGITADYFLSNEPKDNISYKIDLVNKMMANLTENQLDALIEILKLLLKDNDDIY